MDDKLTVFTVTGLDAGVTYYYRIRALSDDDDDGDGVFSTADGDDGATNEDAASATNTTTGVPKHVPDTEMDEFTAVSGEDEAPPLSA